MRFLVVISIHYIILNKTFIANQINKRKTLQINEIPSCYCNSLHYFI